MCGVCVFVAADAVQLAKHINEQKHVFVFLTAKAVVLIDFYFLK